MLIDDPKKLRVVQGLINQAVHEARTARMPVPVNEMAETILNAAGGEKHDAAEVVSRLSVHSISRFVPLAFRTINSPGDLDLPHDRAADAKMSNLLGQLTVKVPISPEQG